MAGAAPQPLPRTSSHAAHLRGPPSMHLPLDSGFGLASAKAAGTSPRATSSGPAEPPPSADVPPAAGLGGTLRVSLPWDAVLLAHAAVSVVRAGSAGSSAAAVAFLARARFLVVSTEGLQLAEPVPDGAGNAAVSAARKIAWHEVVSLHAVSERRLALVDVAAVAGARTARVPGEDGRVRTVGAVEPMLLVFDSAAARDDAVLAAGFAHRCAWQALAEADLIQAPDVFRLMAIVYSNAVRGKWLLYRLILSNERLLLLSRKADPKTLVARRVALDVRHNAIASYAFGSSTVTVHLAPAPAAASPSPLASSSASSSSASLAAASEATAPAPFQIYALDAADLERICDELRICLAAVPGSSSRRASIVLRGSHPPPASPRSSH